MFSCYYYKWLHGVCQNCLSVQAVCSLDVDSRGEKNKAFFQLLVSCECLSPITALHTPGCFAVCTCICVTCTQNAQVHVNVHPDSAFPLRYTLIVPREWESNRARGIGHLLWSALALRQPGFCLFGHVPSGASELS